MCNYYILYLYVKQRHMIFILNELIQFLNHIKLYSLQLERLPFSSTSTKCIVIKHYMAGAVARGLLEPYARNCVSLSSQYASSKYFYFFVLFNIK